jgi:hypothetical protein
MLDRPNGTTKAIHSTSILAKVLVNDTNIEIYDLQSTIGWKSFRKFGTLVVMIFSP